MDPVTAAPPATESALAFNCAGETLVGVLHRPDRAKPRGVIVVVGAPQYRVGSHRQFVLLARALAAAGFPVLRFDYRGMGDSGGEFTGFEGIDRDIGAAVDCLFAEVEGLSDVVLWGLCDGASAAAFYAARDPRVGGLVIVNPWVRTGLSLARARLTRYYIDRLLSRAFWAKLLRRKVDIGGSLRGVAASAATVVRGPAPAPPDALVLSPAREGAPDLPKRVGAALRRFEKPTLLILCGADLVAQEFEAEVVGAARMKHWRSRAGMTLRTLQGANHTYATADWRARVHAWTIDWLDQNFG